MSLTIIAIATILALLLVAAARASRAQGDRHSTTWVCRVCHAEFKRADDAYLHWEAAHEQENRP